jgi:hypothetical protein
VTLLPKSKLTGGTHFVHVYVYECLRVHVDRIVGNKNKKFSF